MRYVLLAASVSALLGSTASAQEQQVVASFELTNALTTCAAALDAAQESGHSVEGLATARMSSKGALEFLLGKTGMNSERRRMMSELRANAVSDLAANPMSARESVRAQVKKCMEHVYEAEDVRVHYVEAQAAETARREKLEADLRFKEAEATQAAKIEADRQHALEIAKLNADTERLRINKVSDLETERLKTGVETKKIDAATSVQLSTISADTIRHAVDKHAEVEIDRNNANVETSKVQANAIIGATQINADADVAVAGKLVDIANVHEATKLEIEKTKATARVEVARSQSEAISNRAARSTSIDDSVAVIPNGGLVAEGASTIVNAAPGALAAEAVVVDKAALLVNALECGGFYWVMQTNAPPAQQAGISALARSMFDTARNHGATDAMISDAPKHLMNKIKATATQGKQPLQNELSSLKVRCATLGTVASLQ